MELDTAAQHTHQCPSCIIEEEIICQPVKLQCHNCQIELEPSEELHQCTSFNNFNEVLEEICPETDCQQTFNDTSIQ